MTLLANQGCSEPEDVDIIGAWRPTAVRGLVLPPGFSLDAATLTFFDDGRWIGENGCGDTDSGSYSVEGDRLSISGESIDSGTDCPGGGEVDYLTVLTGEVAGVRRPSGDQLLLVDDDGDVVLELEPATGPAEH